MAKFSRKKSVNVMRIGVKVVGTVIALYASGFMLTIVGNIMNGTCSPFYVGLRLIGWSVSGGSDTTQLCTDLGQGAGNTIYSTSGTGILSVIGLLAIVWILFEFVDIRL